MLGGMCARWFSAIAVGDLYVELGTFILGVLPEVDVLVIFG